MVPSLRGPPVPKALTEVGLTRLDSDDSSGQHDAIPLRRACNTGWMTLLGSLEVCAA